MLHIVDLGELTGEVLLFGGPYSNLQATIALMNRADRAGIAAGNRICTGDLVAYCADADATVAEIRARGGPVLAGNCEKQLAENAGDCGCGFAPGSTCSVLARGWYAYASAQMNVQDRAYFGGLPERILFRHSGKRYVVIHGGASDISRFIWPTDPEAVFMDEISALKAQIGSFDGVVAGHSGIAFHRKLAGIDWINAGVIGMPPNDGTSLTTFAVLSDGGVRFETLSYDHRAAASAMENVGLTQGYDRALVDGYWPSEDILPRAMRRHVSSRASG